MAHGGTVARLHRGRLQYAFGSASKRAWRLRYLAHRDAGGMRMARDLEADRLVFWQTPEEEGAGGNEIASWLINLDMDFDDLFSSEYIQVRFGKLPTMNLDKLSYYDSQEFLFKSIFIPPFKAL